MQCIELRSHRLRLAHELCQAMTGYVVNQRRETVGNGLLHICKLGAKLLRRERQCMNLFWRIMPSLRKMCQAFGKLAGRFDECDDTADSADNFHGGRLVLASGRVSMEREDLKR